jgi:2-methylisocitrate lyase-like PEP mutase family enzyme
MLSAHTDSDFFGIGNPKVSQLFGLVVLETIAQVADLGVARASYGPAPYFAAMQDLTARFNSLSI